MSTAPTIRISCLCAAWCTTCEAYRAVFAGVAARHPSLDFAWVDIEDEADALGEEPDVRNFPTLLVDDGTTVHFLGTVLPHEGTLERLAREAAAGQVPRGVDEGVSRDPLALARAIAALPPSRRRP